MRHRRRALFALLFTTIADALTGGAATAQDLDLVITGGRIMDPASGLDALRDVGVRDGRVVAVSESRLSGRATIDARGLVVAPGFIDLHAHGQDPVSNAFQAADGVTTALECESGVWPVARWIESRRGQAVVNYGATAGHMAARASAASTSPPSRTRTRRARPGSNRRASITGKRRAAAATNCCSGSRPASA